MVASLVGGKMGSKNGKKTMFMDKNNSGKKINGAA
jgi:hypothetical protein